jgi:F-type H+-transporting ATPase subunit gamma
VREETLLPLRSATLLEGDERDQEGAEGESGHHALVEYEPEPEAILARLVPDYVEISIFRALLESTAVRARRPHDRDAQRPPRNAGEVIDDLTPGDEPRPPGRDHAGDMEVVAGAESV